MYSIKLPFSTAGFFFINFCISLLIVVSSLAQPHISSISPSSGPVGSNVTISGSGFSTTAANNIVYFGPVRATVNGTNVFGSQIGVTVPVGATYQPISVTVNNLTGYAPKTFTVTFPGPGTGIVSNSLAFVSTISSAVTSAALGDFDSDGKPELVTASNNSFSVFKNTSTTGSISFATKIDFATLIPPSIINTADFDGDGKQEIYAANIGTDSVVIIRNTSATGTIAFAPAIKFPLPTSPTDINSSDLDGDGKPDIVTTNVDVNQNSMSILRNTSTVGNISFATRIDIATAAGPFGFSIDDIDGDGKQDLALANENSGVLSIYRNTSTVGNISFTRIDFSAPSPNDIFIGDVDGDSKLDVCYTFAYNNENQKVRVLRNLSTPGTISFAAFVDFVTEDHPNDIKMADMDGDGKPDIVTTNGYFSTPTYFSVLRNMSTAGTIAFATKQKFGIGGQSPNEFVVGDLDGDSKPDVVSANGNTGTILRNQVFEPLISIFSPANGNIGTTITITGSNFTGATSVKFGGRAAASFTVVSSTSITAVVGNTGTSGNVTVTTPYGTASYAGFVFALAPTVNSVSTATITNGLTVIIGGTNFTGTTDVNFGGTPASSFAVLSSTSISAVVGNGSSGKLSITTPYGTVQNTTLTYIPPPLITSFSPTAAGPGNTISISGNNFSTATVITFGGIEAYSYTVVSPTLITAVMNLGASGAVTVHTEGGTASLNGFTFISPPTITSFSPSSGAAGTTVSITGTNFSTTPANNIVYFGAVKAVISSSTTTMLNVIVPQEASYNPITVTTNNLTAYAAFPFVVTFPNGGSIAANSFASNISLAAASGTMNIIESDIDGDGKADIVTVNNISNNFSVFRNTSTAGNISFEPRMDFTTAASPTHICVSDFDTDGKPDIIVSSAGTTNTYIYKNSSTAGNISFAPAVEFQISYVFELTDFDNDGRPDIVNIGTNNNVSVYRNSSINGVISFEPARNFTTAAGPSRITIGDINGDGNADIISANSNTISVLRNLSTPGRIAFAAKTDFSIVNDPRDILISDFDSDGKNDILVGSVTPTTISVFRNTSSGTTISFANRMDFSAGSSANLFSAGNIDGDSKPDIVMLNPISNSIFVFRNTSTAGNISFAPKVDFSTVTASRAISNADLDGDSKPELIYTLASGSFSIRRNIIGVPLISSFTPLTGAPGSAITITGTNFTGASSVNIGGIAATSFTVLSPTTIVAIVATGAAASNNISVTTGGDTTNVSGFNYSATISLNLKLFSQGYYIGAGKMQPVLFNEAVSNNINETDTILVELHDAINFETVASSKAILNTDGTATFNFNIPAGSYFIVIKHRNMIETWSATALSINVATPYDFSVASSKAYGNNEIEMEPGIWAIYTGDINQDGFIDGNDFAVFDQDSFNGLAFEYVATDLNGDGFVDGNDFSVFDVNSLNGVTSLHPQ